MVCSVRPPSPLFSIAPVVILQSNSDTKGTDTACSRLAPKLCAYRPSTPGYQTDRQAGRQAGRQTDRETDR